MKSNSNVRPPIFQDLGDGSWYYNYNIKEVPAIKNNIQEEREEEKTAFEYETVHIWWSPNYAKIVTAIISEQYSKDDEIALLNKGIENISNADYVAYREWVNSVKTMVKNDLNLN
ncbi:MAG: hypothetical protein LBS55_02170 [Prevotellaceae bacterium]|jgi:hypothetical protein|nr:hypothetical protein [Prevotellaceae bacterium]